MHSSIRCLLQNGFGLLPQAAFIWALVIGASAAESGSRSLFDGQSLAGWRGDPQFWRVEQGAIVGEIPAGQRLRHNTWLVWEEGKLEDFELRLEFRLAGEPAANSGIQFRCQVRDMNHVSGYQADLDMGATWLGRIYDEHGRALLVERGTRVWIKPDGQKVVERFADPALYKVLFREMEWNDYRIRASGEHIRIEINGTLFSELIDQQTAERDLSGGLALQLHSGPATKVEFRNIQLRRLEPGSVRVEIGDITVPGKVQEGQFPKGTEGRALNLGFEEGSLKDWTAQGEAFAGQPVNKDSISSRWPGQTSGKAGDFFIGGFELAQDAPTGELKSSLFEVTHPYASFLIGGGAELSTRAEIIRAGEPEQVIHTATGMNSEQMRRVYVDLKAYQGQRIYVRLVDASSGGWGHLNFDDFRFLETLPEGGASMKPARLQENPILAHLQPNPAGEAARGPAAETVRSMHVEPGFALELIAQEPTIHQPIAFAFDERGRLWVVEAFSYPQKRPEGEGEDRITILADQDGDGQFESRKVFIEGLNLVSGIELGYGGVWVGEAPRLLFIPDRNGDDVPDGEPEVLLDGFGFQDTHETLNSFVWGPDGWLYGNQGVFNYSRIGKPGAPDAERVALSAGVWRYHPVRHEFEVFAFGGSNQWGLDFNDYGQLFMTHCRSYWGKGGTTHVIQGGHFWNQANQGYAEFISNRAPEDYGFFVNYLLASARYDHGEGGAGKPGTRRIYGGHSPVGTMIYLGDNWPDEFRDHLFTHNLHGHQLNHQINLREGSGYHTVHAGRDLLYCPDPRYIAVDLQYGPDGAVYLTDWYDQQHCHNPNTEHWDRGNGRIYRLAYAANFKPVRVNLASMTDDQLAGLQNHRNDWQVRTARRLLHERAARGPLAKESVAKLRGMAQEHPEAGRRLRALWALHGAGGLDETVAQALLKDAHEYVRAWTIQLLADNRAVSPEMLERFVRLARSDASAVVRLYLASAIQRVPPETGWQLAEALAARSEDAHDRNLPLMIWYGVARLLPENLDRAFRLASQTRLPALSHYISWYAAKLGGQGLDRLIGQLRDGNRQRDLLEAAALALEDQRNLAMPAHWPAVAPGLYQSENQRVRFLAETLGSVFDDRSLFPRMRRVLADTASPLAQRRHAFQILANASDAESVPLFQSLLDEESFRLDAINLLARFDHASSAEALLRRFDSLTDRERTAALNTLTRRITLAHPLLDAVIAGTLKKEPLTAFYVRQLSNLGDPRILEKLAQVWGKVGTSSAQQQQAAAQLNHAYSEAPLWAYSGAEGKKHFALRCANCHQVKGEGVAIGPDLTGSGSNGARYFIENILDPNAVIGNNYQMSMVETKDGELISGIIQNQTDTAISIRTLTDTVVIPRSKIVKISTSENSMMPEGLLEGLNDREIIELLKYLSSI